MVDKNLGLIVGGTLGVLVGCSGIVSLLGLGSTYHIMSGSGRAIGSEVESVLPDRTDYAEDVYDFLNDVSREFVHGGVEWDTVDYYWKRRINSRYAPDRQVDSKLRWREVELETRQAIDEDDLHKLGYMGFGAGVASLILGLGILGSRRRNG